MNNLIPGDLKIIDLIRTEMNSHPRSLSIVLRGVTTDADSITRVINHYIAYGWKGEYHDGDTDVADETGAGYLEFKKV
jgi:hypothetical protein